MQLEKVIAMATSMISSSGISNPVISEVAQKIKSEMNDLASVAHDSILRNYDSAVKNFQWETVSTELSEKMPTLMLLLTQLIPKPTKSKPLLCMLASMILKSRHHPHVGLVQRVMSVMLYGNSIAKQVN